jgi:quinoprotein glucose dehydrogenase
VEDGGVAPSKAKEKPPPSHWSVRDGASLEPPIQRASTVSNPARLLASGDDGHIVGRFTMLRFRGRGTGVAAAAACCLLGMTGVHAQHQLGGLYEPPKVAAASDAGEKAIRRFQLPPGWKAELWAAEPDLAQPVCLYVDDKGRIYVCETFRHSNGVDDIRNHMDWLDEELASVTADDRVALLRRHFKDDLSWYTGHTERVQLLEDTKGSGRADRSVVFAEGFTNVLDGVAAGVLARGNDVYLANIPNLWLLRDNNGDGVADMRRSLSWGYGVRGGFLGHDLHGLAWGPDGKLYFSIGDRAANILVNGRYVGNPDCGAVFRCEADGSGLEMYCFGLRNPQGLVFDDYGNLFTGDNNSDGGDKARWAYLVEGADNGWRIGYQFIEASDAPTPRGPWNAERMWAPANPDQPAYTVPPIENIADGPSGVSYYPGTGGPKDFDGTFTLADFRGSIGVSGIHRFKLEADGATFRLVAKDKLAWAVLATDGNWGPDSAFYMTDWVEGWNPNGKGRIYRLTHEASRNDPIVASTKALLREDFSGKSAGDLIKLLGHPNRRVRQNAQFALAAKGESTEARLISQAKGGLLKARLHAIWALGQVYHQTRKPGSAGASPGMDALVPLLRDAEVEVRANAARVLGDAAYPKAYPALGAALADANPRVVSLAALAVAKFGRADAMPLALEVLRGNKSDDAVVRHAAVTILARCATGEEIAALAGDPSDAVRMGALLALRRQHRSEVAGFLKDRNPRLVLEAARAINDEPISGAMASLAALDVSSGSKEALLRRVVNANLRCGYADTAQRLAALASRADLPESIRVEALEALTAWPKNAGRDRITGLWRPVAFNRDPHQAADALRPASAGLLGGVSGKVARAAAEAAAAVGLADAGPALAALAVKAGADGEARAAAIRALVTLQSPEAAAAVAKAAEDSDSAVRKAAVEAGTRLPRVSSTAAGSGSDQGLGRIAAALENGSLGDKQSALAVAAGLPGTQADALIEGWMKRLLDGSIPDELKADVLEAAAKRPSLKPLLDKWDASVPKGGENDIGPWRVCLTGGNAEAGRKVFFERPEVSCMRCHKVSGEGGEVGPDLTGIGQKRPRDYIVQSIVFPNAQIAPGFENVLVTLKNGNSYAGVVKGETADELKLNSPEDGMLTLKKSDITSREKGLSGMPEGFGSILSKTDLRNVVEFLATAK